MSLINCPECNHKISSNAKSCPKCGYTIKKKDIEQQLTLFCPECNSTIPNLSPTCPKCGYVFKKHHSSKILLIFIALFIILIGLSVSIFTITKKQSELERKYEEFNGFYSDISKYIDVYIEIKNKQVTLYYFNEEDSSDYIKIKGKIDFSGTNYGDEVTVNFEDVVYNDSGDSSKDWGEVYLKSGESSLSPSGRAITLKTTDKYICPTKLDIFFKISSEKFYNRLNQ